MAHIFFYYQYLPPLSYDPRAATVIYSTFSYLSTNFCLLFEKKFSCTKLFFFARTTQSLLLNDSLPSFECCPCGTPSGKRYCFMLAAADCKFKSQVATYIQGQGCQKWAFENHSGVFQTIAPSLLRAF